MQTSFHPPDDYPAYRPVSAFEILKESEITITDLLEWEHHPMAAMSRRRTLNPEDSKSCREHCRLFNIHYRNPDGEIIPVILVYPNEAPQPIPVVLLAHGFSSSKNQMIYWQAGQLSQRGIASLAIDFPFHGERTGYPHQIRCQGDYAGFYRNIRQSVKELRELIDFAESRKELKTFRGVALVGYSMGSWIATQVAAVDTRIAGLTLMVEGGVEVSDDTRASDSEFFGIIHDRQELWQRFPDTRTDLLIPQIAPTPLLMINGLKDKLISASLAKILFAEAGEPKQQLWYDSGHILPRKHLKIMLSGLQNDLTNFMEKTYASKDINL